MKKAVERELLEFLRDIDARLGGETLKGKLALYVFGDAAAMIAYGCRHGTVDIDVYLEDKRMSEKLAEWGGAGTELAKRHGLYFRSANTSLMLLEAPAWKERCVKILKDRLKHIQVLALGKEDLVLSKLGRYSDRDREDIKFLIEKREIDPKMLTASYRSARRHYAGCLETIDQAFNIVLEEHFGRKPLAFGSTAS